MEIKQRVKVTTEQIAQEYINACGWRGALIEIRDCLPAGDYRRKKIETAIALIPTEAPCGITMKSAIVVKGLPSIINALVENEEVTAPENNSNPCPKEVLEILKSLDDQGRR